MVELEKRLYRTRTDRWILGVCGGLGKYFAVDPVIIRILAILLAFTGIGLVAYILLAILVPVEGSIHVDTEGVVQENARDIEQTAQKICKDFKEAFSDRHEVKTDTATPEQPPVPNRMPLVLALVLIVIGLTILFSVLDIWQFFYGIILGVILIVVGVLIIIGLRRR